MSCNDCVNSCTTCTSPTTCDRPRALDTNSLESNSCENVLEIIKDMPLEKIIENCISFYDDQCQPMEEFEKIAIAEFVESKRKAKYLYDGWNMVKLKPSKNAIVKAILGRAYYSRRLMQQKLEGDCLGESTPGTCKPRAIMSAAGDCDQLGTISDYAPCTGAKVPVIIQNICFEIEYRAKSGCEAGTYRLAGKECDIRELKEAFLAQEIPCIADTDLHTLTGTLKSFLGGLKESLIPPCSREAFIDAALIKCSHTKDATIKSLVKNLPEANRDTLAFLIPHLQRISSCPDADIPIRCMATEFSKLLMGHSDVVGAELMETKLVVGAVEALLHISPGFWNKVLEASACH